MLEFAIDRTPLTKAEIEQEKTDLTKKIATLKKRRLIVAITGIVIIAGLSMYFWLSGFLTGPQTIAVAAFAFTVAVVVVFAAGDAFAVAAVTVAAVAVIYGAVFAVAAVAVAYGMIVSVKIENLESLISSLIPITEKNTDCTALQEAALRCPEIKAYIKAVATLEPPRSPVMGEYEMLVAFDRNYESRKPEEQKQAEAERACEAICAGEIG